MRAAAPGRPADGGGEELAQRHPGRKAESDHRRAEEHLSALAPTLAESSTTRNSPR